MTSPAPLAIHHVPSFRDSGAATGLRTARFPGRHVAVAVDGSEGSRAAYNVASALVGKQDTITVVHVVNTDKVLPAHLAHMAAPSIRTTYETLNVTRFVGGQSKVDISDKPAGLDTKSALLARIQKVGANFLVVGFTGRKGPKEDPTILGSSADFSLRAARMPVCIVKGEKGKSYSARDTHVFVVAVDGSDRSHACLELTRSISKDGDRIIVVHVTEGTSEAVADRATVNAKAKYSDNAINERYSAYCREFSGTDAGIGFGSSSAPVVPASPSASAKPSPVASSVSGHGSTVVASSSFLQRTGSKASMSSPSASLISPRLPTPVPVSPRPTAAPVSPSASSAPPTAGAGSTTSPRASKAVMEYQILSRTTGPTVADVVLNYAEDINADFICIGADGVGRFAQGKKDKLGSTSDGIIRKAHCNVIVMQEVGGVLAEEGTPSARK